MTSRGPVPGEAPTPKSSLRSVIRRQRAAEPEALQVARARRMTGTAGAVADLAGPGLAGFLPTNSEPDVLPLLRCVAAPAQGSGIPVYLPTPAAGSSLDWVRADPASLRVVARGIPRPTGRVVEHGSRIDRLVAAVLVPALALDPVTGARLGYGAGYYDRLLAGLGPGVDTIGVCREVDLRAVPVEEHDRAVGWILTEEGLRRPAHPDAR